MVKSILILLSLAVVGHAAIKPVLFQDDPWSCQNRCNKSGTVDPGCQCNYPCVNFGDCCPDYYTICLGQGQEGTCAGKCDTVGTDPDAPCQCNKPCQQYGDCCPDYEDECGSSGGPITNAELEALSEELFAMENTNNVAGLVTVNRPGPILLTVDPQAYEVGTIALFVKLLDNYFPETSRSEQVTLAELEEEKIFLDAVFATGIMQRAMEFLGSKGLPNTREKFYEMWFGMYSRGAVDSSSGFEHIFLGELRSGVSGFHNWVFFAKEEEAGRLSYTREAVFVDLGDKGSIIEHSFSWQGQTKPVSSMYIGTSPELELALTTVCFIARPGVKCAMSLANNKFNIQTYTIGSNNQFVASGYPDLSN